MKYHLLLIPLVLFGGGCVTEHRIRVTGYSKTICVSDGLKVECGERGFVSDEMLSAQLLEKIRVRIHDEELERVNMRGIEEKLNKEHK